jgi:hypothetical protein
MPSRRGRYVSSDPRLPTYRTSTFGTAFERVYPLGSPSIDGSPEQVARSGHASAVS